MNYVLNLKLYNLNFEIAFLIIVIFHRAAISLVVSILRIPKYLGTRGCRFFSDASFSIVRLIILIHMYEVINKTFVAVYRQNFEEGHLVP